MARYNLDFPSPRELFESLPESNLAELVDNVLFVCEPATLYHQQASDALQFELTNYVRKKRLGMVFSNTGIFLGNNSVVVPDLVFVSNKNKLKQQREGLIGAPDLVIEVLSRSTRWIDNGAKKRLFQRYKVKEYWMIHPETKKAFGYLLEGRRFGEPMVLNGEVQIRILGKTFKF